MTITHQTTTAATKWDVAAKRAPLVLAIMGAISIWAGPSLFLHEGQQSNRRVIQENTVGIARLEERLTNVESGLQEVKVGLIRLEGKLDRLDGKLDQLIFHLMGEQP